MRIAQLDEVRIYRQRTYLPSFLYLGNLSLGPLIGEYHWRPNIAIRLLAQAAHTGKWHVGPRDQDGFARKRWQQPIPGRRSCRVVDVKDDCDVAMTQLNKLVMDGVAPKQDFLSAR
jgi:hypothetical protein